MVRCGLCLVANHVSLASTSAAFVTSGTLKKQFQFLPLPGWTTYVVVNFQRICIWLYFLLAEVDRVNCQTEMEEAEALQKQYQGSIRHASCSEVRDEENIRHEMGDQVDEVDQVIQVLLKAGMTSDALRAAYLQGVELRHAGFVQVAIPCLCSGLCYCWVVGCWGNTLSCFMKLVIHLQKSIHFGRPFNSHQSLLGLPSCVCLSDAPSMKDVSC